jgi:hypothetical protein
MTDTTTNPADPKAAEGTPGYGDQGPAGAGADGRGVIDVAYGDKAGAPATQGAILRDEDDASERQTDGAGGSSSTGG